MPNENANFLVVFFPCFFVTFNQTTIIITGYYFYYCATVRQLLLIDTPSLIIYHIFAYNVNARTDILHDLHDVCDVELFTHGTPVACIHTYVCTIFKNLKCVLHILFIIIIIIVSRLASVYTWYMYTHRTHTAIEYE